MPVLKFKAELDTAGIFGLIAYIVFTIRAGNHVYKAARITKYLLSLDPDLVGAVLTTPSIAVGGPIPQVLLPITIGGLAVGGNYLSMATAMEAVQMSPWHDTALVVAPALYLAIQLIAWKFNAGIARDSA